MNENFEIIYGKNSVIEALNSENREINKILISKNIHTDNKIEQIKELCKNKGIIFQFVGKDKFAPYEEFNHQGVIAQISPIEYMELDDFIENFSKKEHFGSLVMLDGVEDSHNLGAIIRSAEAAGAHGIIVPKRRSASLTYAVSKTSAGALEYMPVVRVPNIPSAIDDLKKHGIWVYAADMDGSLWCDTDMKGPIALVVGSEGRGVGRLVRDKCDFTVSLPMKGKINSLNASVAAGILMFEISRQRLKSGGTVK